MCHVRRSNDASLAYYTYKKKKKKKKTGRDLASFKSKEGATIRQLLEESK